MKAFWITAFALLLAAAAPAVGYAQEAADRATDEAAAAPSPADEQDESEGAGEAESEAASDDGAGAGAEEVVDTEEGGDAAEVADAEEPADAEDSTEAEESAGGDAEDDSEIEEDFGPVTISEGGTFWMPPQASTVAEGVDWLFYAIIALSIFCFAGIAIALVYFVIRYRARDGRRAEPSPSHNDAMEITWTVIPSIIVVIVFVLGWQGYMKLAAAPQHAEEIRVTAQKWSWQFTYPNGYVDSRLHVPTDRPVKLVMRSEDVLHSLFIPAFRVKMDVIPNRYSRMWFEANDPGTYRLYCTEYCGDDHSSMITEVVVHPPGGYQNFLDEAQQKMLDLPPVELGELLYEMRGCNQCHSIDGTDGKGPSFQGIWGAEHALEDGSTVTVDDNYIRSSLLDPQADVRAGFNPIMPTFAGKLSDREIDGLIEFIKSLQ